MSPILAYDLPFYQCSYKKKLKNFVESRGIDALHIHDMVIARAVFRVNRAYKLPVIIDFHENRPEIMKSYHLQQRPRIGLQNRHHEKDQG